jgi:hypothetical protein
MDQASVARTQGLEGIHQNTLSAMHDGVVYILLYIVATLLTVATSLFFMLQLRSHACFLFVDL